MTDQQQKYQSTGRVVVTVENRENKTEVVKKNIVKQLNEKTGKFETKTIEVPKQSVAQQIENTKAEINQADEISKKLAEQHKLLREQVTGLRALVAEKAKQYKKDEEERKKKLMKMIKANNLEINIAARTPEQVAARLKELEKEFESAQSVAKVLAKEREMAKKQNEATEVTQQIQNLQLKLEEKKKQLRDLKKQNAQFQRQDQQNQKKLDKMEQGTDEAQQINTLNKELTMLREKENKIKQKIDKTQKEFEITQQTIQSYINVITKLYDEDKVEELKKKFEEINTKWEEKLKQLDEEETKLNMQLIKELKEKKKEEKEKEKDKEQKPEDQDKKPKQVKAYIKEKRDVSQLVADEPNFVQLFALHQQMDKQLKKLKKKIEVEKDQMESLNNNLKLEKANAQILIKEKEREKEIAESLVNELRDKLGERLKMEQEQRERAEKLKTTGRAQLSPLGAKDKRWEKTTVETLRAKKDEQLKQFKEKFQKLPKEKGKLYLQEPFKLSYQEMQEKHRRKLMKQDDKEDKTEVKQLTIIETMCKTKHRGSRREWFGYEPNEQTTLCDDVHILGQFSIKHRIQKITVYHNPTEGFIYVIQSDYRKEDGNIISGSWNINQEILKNNKDIQKDELELSENDRIKQISLRRDNNFISFILFQTKLGKQLKVGKEIIEKAEEDKPKEKEGEQQDKEKKDGDGGEKKEENPDRREIKLDNFSMLITLFNGYSQKGEKEVALSFFGYEVGRKLTAEEYEQYLVEKKKRIDEKEKKDKLKRLEESMMSELNQSQLKKR